MKRKYWEDGPLCVSENKKYLRAGETPFFWMGDTAWLLIQRSSREDADLYLKNRADKGFNVIQAVLTNARREGDSLGSLQLMEEVDILRCIGPENEPYWQHVEGVLDIAEELGVYIGCLPIWGKVARRGFIDEKTAEPYANFLAERFGKRKNIIWILGGDIRGSEFHQMWEVMGKILKEKTPDKLIAYHPFGRTCSSYWFLDSPWLDINMFQSGHRRYDQPDLRSWDDKEGGEPWYGEDNWRYVQAELEGYIGLASVKKEVKNLINMVTVHKMRKEQNLPAADLSLHMVFSGNPGTGKTTVARIMARIYHSLGILSKGHLVEVDRSGLVAGYVGQTALKAKKVIDSALGGVLFIDEAYALNGGAENDFGQEAIDTILKAMEDHRDDLVVIAAGYDDLMDRFIHSNPGLESRFNRFLHFADYTPDEMMKIFEMQCKKGCYTLEAEAAGLVRGFIEEENTDPASFGNARGVRNIFEQILVNQANRLAAMEQVTREDLMSITPADVQAARGMESAAPVRESPAE